jgi:hypothetical protein
MSYVLEQRKCVNNGCVEVFRVMATSKQQVCSLQCTENSEPLGRQQAAKRARRNAQRAEAKDRPTQSPKDPDEL